MSELPAIEAKNVSFFYDGDDGKKQALCGIDLSIPQGDFVAVLGENGWTVANVDCTVIAQRPKLAPYIRRMREVLANAMGVGTDRVSVKATTEEKLGFTGEGLGIAAHAVALIEEKS